MTLAGNVLRMPERAIALDANGLPVGHQAARRKAVDLLLILLHEIPDSWTRFGYDDVDEILSTVLLAYVQELRDTR